MCDHIAYPVFSSSKALDDSHLLGDKNVERLLPVGYQPTDCDVLCGRGKECYSHAGNRRYRQMIEERLQDYMSTNAKLQKSFIVIAIVRKIQQDSPDGGFIKKDRKTGRWVALTDTGAREKVGQTIRERMTQLDPTKRKEKRTKRAIRRAIRRAQNQAGAESVAPAKAAKMNNEEEDFDLDTRSIDHLMILPAPEPVSFDFDITPIQINDTTPLQVDDDLLRSLQDDLASLDSAESGDTASTTESERAEFENFFRMPPFAFAA